MDCLTVECTHDPIHIEFVTLPHPIPLGSSYIIFDVLGEYYHLDQFAISGPTASVVDLVANHQENYQNIHLVQPVLWISM